jgi:ABC-type transporter Mla maintaining outer membrane lipid asymmetry ATPase subunit MlaF
MILGVEDFNKAMSWLVEAELAMPVIFKEGSIVPDSKVMDEVAHFVKEHGEVSEHLVRNFVRERVPAMHIKHVMEAMEAARMIVSKRVDPKTGLRVFVAE